MAELLEAGIELTVIGMAVVFVMLTLLVGIVQLTSRFCRLLETATPAAPETVPTHEIDAEITSAIAAAVHRFRRERSPRSGGP